MQALSNQSTPQNEHYQDVGLHTEFEQYQNEHLQNEQYPNIIGYEPAGLTVHPPQNDRGWVHFFRMDI